MAMNRIEILLAARDQTKAAFASASASLERLGTSATGFIGKFGGITAVVAGAAAAITALENVQAIKILDQLDDLSEKTGISVEKLSELRYAGETTGTNFEALTSGIGRLAKQMAAAAGGNKEAQATFQALGVEVTDAEGKLRSTDDVLLDVANRFAGYEDGAGKSALAQRAFGKSGAELIPILNQGAAGIQRLSSEAKALGVVYDSKTAKAAADFNDNLTKIRLSSEATAVSIAGPLVSSLARLSTEFVEAKKNGGLFAAGLQSYFSGVRQFWSGDMFSGKTVPKTTKEIQDWVNSRGGPSAGGGRGFVNPQVAAPIVSDEPKLPKGGGGTKTVKDLEADAKRYLETLDKQLEKTEKLSAVELALAEIRRITADGGKVTEAMKQQILLKAADIDITKERADAKKKADDAQEESQRRLFALMDEGKRVFEETRTPLEAYNIELARLNDLQKAGVITAETQARAVQLAADAYDEAKKKAAAAAAEGDEFAKRAAGNIQDSLGSGLADLLDGNYKNLGDGFRKMINRMVAEAGAANLSRRLFGNLVDGGEGEGLLSGPLRSMGLLVSGNKSKKGTDALDALLGSNGAFGTAGASVATFSASLTTGTATTTTALELLTSAATNAAGALSGAGGGDALGSLASLFGGSGYSAADQAGLDSLIAGLASYDTGTDFVPEDMIAKIHKGERIVPAAQNKPGFGGVNVSINQTFPANTSRRTIDQAAQEAAKAIGRAQRNQ